VSIDEHFSQIVTIRNRNEIYITFHLGFSQQE